MSSQLSFTVRERRSRRSVMVPVLLAGDFWHSAQFGAPFRLSPISVLRIRAKCKLPAVRAVEFRVLFVFRNAGSYDLWKFKIFYQEEKVDKSRESRHCRKLVRLPPTSTYGNSWNGACPASNFNVRFRFKGHVVLLPYGRLEVRTRPEPILVWISTYTHAHGVVPITLRRSHPPGQEKRVESFSDFPPSRVRSPSSPNLRDVVFASGVCVCLIMWRKGWGECCSHFVGHLLIASAAIVVSTITSTITISSSRLDLDNSREYRKCGLRFPSAMRYYDFGYGVILILGQECWGLKDV